MEKHWNAHNTLLWRCLQQNVPLQVNILASKLSNGLSIWLLINHWPRSSALVPTHWWYYWKFAKINLHAWCDQSISQGFFLTRKSVKPWSQDKLIAARTYPGFCSMKRLEIFLLPLDGMLVHCRSLPHNLLGCPNNLPVPIYTPGWREELWELSVLPKNTTQCPRPGLEPERSHRSRVH